MSNTDDKTPSPPPWVGKLAGLVLGLGLLATALTYALFQFGGLREQYCKFVSSVCSKPVMKTKEVPEVVAGYSRPGGGQKWGRFEAPDDDACVRPDPGMEFVKGAHFIVEKQVNIAGASGSPLKTEERKLVCYTVFAYNTSGTDSTAISGRIEVYQRPIMPLCDHE